MYEIEKETDIWTEKKNEPILFQQYDFMSKTL